MQIAIITYAQTSVPYISTDYIPNIDDIVEYEQILYLPEGDSGAYSIFDFRNAEFIGDDFVIENCISSDRIEASLLGTKYKYHLLHDSIRYTTLENAESKILYNNPLKIKYPLAYNDEIIEPLSGELHLNQTIKSSFCGKQILKADAYGWSILPNNDSLRTLRVYQKQTYKVNSIDIEYTCFSYYADGIKYPIVEHITSKYKTDDKKDSTVFVTVFMQKDITESFSRQWNFLLPEISESDDNNEDFFDDISYQLYPTPFADNLNITIENCVLYDPYQIFIYDSTGRLCYDSGKITAKSTIEDYVFICKNFTSGIYIVNLQYGNHNYVKKILHK